LERETARSAGGGVVLDLLHRRLRHRRSRPRRQESVVPRAVVRGLVVERPSLFFRALDIRATSASAKGPAQIIFSRAGELHRRGERICAGPARPSGDPMIQNQQSFPEAAEARIARFRRAVAYWRAKGYVYVTLTPKGNAQPHHAGKLALLLRTIERYPGAQLIELAAPDAEQQIISWALKIGAEQHQGFN
jgi:hypothetical protein